MVLNDGMVRRPAVIDYKLVDVPELGYFGAISYPRASCWSRRKPCSPATTSARMYRRGGFYRTGDIMAKSKSPDHLDRRNDVLKLSRAGSSPSSKLRQ